MRKQELVRGHSLTYSLIHPHRPLHHWAGLELFKFNMFHIFQENAIIMFIISRSIFDYYVKLLCLCSVAIHFEGVLCEPENDWADWFSRWFKRSSCLWGSGRSGGAGYWLGPSQDVLDRHKVCHEAVMFFVWFSKMTGLNLHRSSKTIGAIYRWLQIRVFIYLFSCIYFIVHLSIYLFIYLLFILFPYQPVNSWMQ